MLHCTWMISISFFDCTKCIGSHNFAGEYWSIFFLFFTYIFPFTWFSNIPFVWFLWFPNIMEVFVQKQFLLFPWKSWNRQLVVLILLFFVSLKHFATLLMPDQAKSASRKDHITAWTNWAFATPRCEEPAIHF